MSNATNISSTRATKGEMIGTMHRNSPFGMEYLKAAKKHNVRVYMHGNTVFADASTDVNVRNASRLWAAVSDLIKRREANLKARQRAAGMNV